MNLTHPVDQQSEPVIGALRIVNGVRREDASLSITALMPESRVARGREGERLFLLLDLSGPYQPDLYQGICRKAASLYWSTSGSITAAVRQAAFVANYYLFHSNLNASPVDRCYGGLAFVVWRGDELFFLQAGPVQTCIHHEGRLHCFGLGDKSVLVGVGPRTSARLDHAYFEPGDTLLVSSAALIRETEHDVLTRAMVQPEIGQVIHDLEQMGPRTNSALLVIRLTGSAEPPRTAARPTHRSTSRDKLSRTESKPRVVPEYGRPASNEERPAPPKREPRAPTRQTTPRRSGPSLQVRLNGAARAIGQGFVRAFAGLGSFLGAVFWRLLPGADRSPYKPTRPSRPVPQEKRAVMLSVAIIIPVLIGIAVLMTYRQFGAEAVIKALISEAEHEADLALAAGTDSEAARRHWGTALAIATHAVQKDSDRAAALAVQSQAQTALDRLDGIHRLTPVELYNFQSGERPLKLAVHGQIVFVLDPQSDWVAKLDLEPSGRGVVTSTLELALIKKGRVITSGDGGTVGDLAGLTWMEAGGERRSDGLVVVEQDGAFDFYNPAWGAESGGPHVARGLLIRGPESVQSVGSYEGRLYILDRVGGQIWRYQPQEDKYPDAPQAYFATTTPMSTVAPVDMAIDGHIYVLYEDGQIHKYLGGETQPFAVTGVTGSMTETVALAMDVAGTDGRLYIADRGNKRIVVLHSDGTFETQLRADGVFESLQDLTVDERANRLYILSAGVLYVAPLP